MNRSSSIPNCRPRREWLRVGGISALGLGLGSLLADRAASAAGNERSFGRARSCIVLFLSGGPPQHETFDPKPAAPVEVRGPFLPIATRVPGIEISELLPRTARIAKHLTIVRSLSTGINAHAASGYSILTGYPHPAGNRDEPASPTDRPSLASVAAQMLAGGSGPLGAVTLPERIVNNPGVAWPGQDGGFMGRSWDPLLLACEPASPRGRADSLCLPEDVDLARLGQRRSLLNQVELAFASTERGGSWRQYDATARRALDVLTQATTGEAFDLSREPASVRDEYGRHKFGQSVLLARRLVEAGGRLVQVNFPREPGDLNIGNPLWDTHSNNAGRVRETLCPALDQAYPALVADLAARGLLDETLVVLVGEFGRSPRINKLGGRDHWGTVFSACLAGAGLPGGRLVGASDRLGGEPKTHPIGPAELAATILHLLGIRPESEFHDRLGRPQRASAGQPRADILG